jgi:hypothetical protein
MLLLLLLSAAHAALTPAVRPYPAQYGVYELKSGQTIVLDGLLNETAWEEVPWSSRFVDIANGPTPYFETRFKARWQGEWLYVGAFLEDTAVWANVTQHDDVIFADNDFEIFVDPQGWNAWYKELEANALAVDWLLMLSHPYIDGGAVWDRSKFDLPQLQVKTYVDGCTINDPSSGPCRGWSVEFALPLAGYVTNDTVPRVPPQAGDLWRWQFSRVEWNVTVQDGHYVKVPGLQESNWVWQPMGVVNVHLPERWGYLCWLDSQVNVSQCRQDATWGLRQALIAVYYAQHQFNVIAGYFTTDVYALGMPAEVLNGALGTNVPVVDVNPSSPWTFSATVTTSGSPSITGYIAQDRTMTFDPPGASVCGPQGCQ